MPGPIREGDSYRCELAGLIAIMILVNIICKAHHVTSGSLQVACDNISTLRIFDPSFRPEPSQESFDLVCCLHHLVKSASVTCSAVHVEGHAADNKPKCAMSRLELLNDEMDHTAKAYWNHLLSHRHPMTAPHLSVANEGWSTWKGATKITSSHQKTLYPLLQDHLTMDYWTKPHTLQPTARIQPEAIRDVDWEACGDNMAALALPRQLWTSKHASENGGVGVTQLAWGKQFTDACPRCGAPETTLHVLTCSAEEADVPWTENNSKLQTFLRDVDTCPHIIKAVTHRLHQLHAGDPTLLAPWLPPEVRRAMAAQDRIGWKNLLEGIPAKHWILAQSRHYKRICATHTNWRRWMKHLLKPCPLYTPYASH